MKKLISFLSAAVFTASAILSNIPYDFSFKANALTYGDYLSYEITAENTVTITDCDESATEIAIPETIDGYNVTAIGDYAFNGCYSLTSVTIPDGVTAIGERAFVGCSSITSVTIPDGVTIISDGAFYNCSSLTSITLPDGVTEIGGLAFSDCYSLISITIPDGVTKIDNDAFNFCSSLTNITIPDSVTVIGKNAFWGTPWLENKQKENPLVIVNDILIDVATCSGDVTIPDNVTKIGDGAFYNCSSLTSIILPDGMTEIGDYTFAYCDSLTNITIPNSVTRIGSWAFSDCDSLTSITIPDSVTEINSDAFHSCSSLTSITIPGSVTWIGYSAFEFCTSLTSITISDGVTKIDEYAFAFCESLTNITIPDSVTAVWEYAFIECDSLTDVYYYGTEEEWNSIAIYEMNDCLTNANIHYLGYPSASDAESIADCVVDVEHSSGTVSVDVSKYVNIQSDTEIDGSLDVSITENGNESISAFDMYWCAYEAGAPTTEFSGEYVFDMANIDAVFADLSEQTGETLTYEDNFDLLLNVLYDENGNGIVVDTFEFSIAQNGDANLDHSIDAKDAAAIAKYSSSTAGLAPGEALPILSGKNNSLAKCAGDANGDGSIDAKDAALIAKYSANSAVFNEDVSEAEKYNTIWEMVS